jgi:hypothetical protein
LELSLHEMNQVELPLTAETGLEVPRDPVTLRPRIADRLGLRHDQLIGPRTAVSVGRPTGTCRVLTSVPKGANDRPEGGQIVRTGAAALKVLLNLSALGLLKPAVEVGEQSI